MGAIAGAVTVTAIKPETALDDISNEFDDEAELDSMIDIEEESINDEEDGWEDAEEKEDDSFEDLEDTTNKSDDDEDDDDDEDEADDEDEGYF